MAVLLELARAGGGVPSDLSGAGVRDELMTLAGHHGLLGLVLRRLERPDAASVLTEETAAEYARTLAFLRRQAAVWDFEREAALPRLRSAGIRALPADFTDLRSAARARHASHRGGSICNGRLMRG